MEAIAAGSEAEAAGLRVGDVIAEVDGAVLTDVQALHRALVGPPGATRVLKVSRGERNLTLVAQVERFSSD